MLLLHQLCHKQCNAKQFELGSFLASSSLVQKLNTRFMLQIFVLGILAGAYIGLGALLMMMVGGRCVGIGATDPGLKAIISGLFGLPCGLMMVIVSGAELFTGNTAVVTAAVLEGEVDIGSLIKSWVVSYAGNLVGSLMLATMAVYAGLFVGGQPAISYSVAKTSMAFGPVCLELSL